MNQVGQRGFGGSETLCVMLQRWIEAVAHVSAHRASTAESRCNADWAMGDDDVSTLVPGVTNVPVVATWRVGICACGRGATGHRHSGCL